MYKFNFLLFGSLLFLFSCTAFNKGGEPFSTYDATPPPDYKPVFILKTADYDPNTQTKPGIEISSIDVRQPNLVKIKLSVVDKDNVHLKGIPADKFKQFWCEIVDSINGKEVKLKNPKIYEVKENDVKNLSFAIVMDHSGSMGEERAVAVQNAIENFVVKKADDENIALIKYDDKVVTESPITNSKTELLKNLKKNGLYGFGNTTATNDGINSGLQELVKLPRNYEKAILVFTDGWDNASLMHKDTLIKFARSNGITINSVDFGENINPDFMKYYSDSTSGIYKHIYLTDEFQYLFDDLYNRLNNYYVIEYKPSDFGDHKLHFKICFPDDTVSAASSFNNTPDIGAIGTLAINFDLNKATIKKETEEDIDQIYAMLKAYPLMVIELRGHTDSLNKTSDPEYNMKLSQKRADAVKDVLVKKGINPDRIFAKGLGESQPIATNLTEDGRAINRRTEFVILKK